MKISLLHPSRGRPEKSFMNSAEWIRKSGVPDVELIVSLDNSDPTLKTYTKIYAGMAWNANNNESVVQATNFAASVCTGDILIYLSDDFTCPENWGQLVIDEFKKYSGPTLIKVDDCLQPFYVKVLTIPMMNRELYEKLGYFWHPGYKSMFVDEDLYHTANKLGALKMAPELKFPHIHPANPDPKLRCDNDETYIRSAGNWNQGQDLFKQRKLMGFPV